MFLSHFRLGYNTVPGQELWSAQVSPGEPAEQYNLFCTLPVPSSHFNMSDTKPLLVAASMCLGIAHLHLGPYSCRRVPVSLYIYSKIKIMYKLTCMYVLVSVALLVYHCFLALICTHILIYKPIYTTALYL